MARSRDLFDDTTMTFGEHLEVLRVHVFRALLGLVLAVGVALVYAMPWLKRNGGSYLRYLLAPAFLWSVATLSSQAFTPFLYFQF